MNRLRVIMIVLLFGIFGIVFISMGVSDTVKLSGDVPDFNYESMKSLKKGDFVQGYVENIVDRYANETTTEKTFGIETSSRVSREYFIMPLLNESDMAEDLYITVSASNSDDRKMLNDICDITWEYIDGKTDTEWIDMPIVAKVKPLEKDLEGYMIEWFRNSEWFDFDGPAGDAEIESHIVPYELSVYRVKSASGFLITGVVMLLFSLTAAIILFARSRNIKSLAEDGGALSEYSSGSGGENGFSEKFTSEPMPYIPQPVQPDEFFSGPLKKPSAEFTEIKEDANSTDASAAEPSTFDGVSGDTEESTDDFTF